jgi:hypothetical protein
MRVLAILILSICTLNAATISRYIDKPEGISMQSYELNNGKAMFRKHSNFFDESRDFSLGDFVPVSTEGINIQEKRLNKILYQIKDVEKFLQTKDQGFNDLTPLSLHESAILIDKFKISKSSILYPEALAIFESLKKRQWRQVAGVKLTEDFKKIGIIQGGKEVKSLEFDFKSFCNNALPPATCRYKDLGPLYVR